MPGFDQVLAAVADAWQNRRDAGRRAGRIDLTETSARGIWPRRRGHAVGRGCCRLGRGGRSSGSSIRITADSAARRSFRIRWTCGCCCACGGDDRRAARLTMVTHTLDKMAAGGIYDQLGGGFHRYSVDERWLVPHFEKMLYDNALLAPLLSRGVSGHRQARLRPNGARDAAITCCAR